MGKSNNTDSCCSVETIKPVVDSCCPSEAKKVVVVDDCCGGGAEKAIVNAITATNIEVGTPKTTFKVLNMDCPDEIKAIKEFTRTLFRNKNS